MKLEIVNPQMNRALIKGNVDKMQSNIPLNPLYILVSSRLSSSFLGISSTGYRSPVFQVLLDSLIYQIIVQYLHILSILFVAHLYTRIPHLTYHKPYQYRCLLIHNNHHTINQVLFYQSVPE